MKNMPNEKQIPSTMMLQTSEANTTTHPHPPSGGSGGAGGSPSWRNKG